MLGLMNGKHGGTSVKYVSLIVSYLFIYLFIENPQNKLQCRTPKKKLWVLRGIKH